MTTRPRSMLAARGFWLGGLASLAVWCAIAWVAFA